ncbi:xanthine dehydrogenase small subunit [Myxococcota bacterium]|nr:xanthine dehydrogenase small subunit [Myxococcota bacterium]
MDRLRFFLNDQLVELSDVSPTTTLLRYLRDHAHLTGTKEGCAEGDCGACSVAVLERDADGHAAYRSVCSCLLFLPMVQGKRVYTVEGLRDGAGYHPVQQAVAGALGSQCGYCTPGVTMSLFEACYRDDLDEPWKLDAQMCGNLCRCTGYRPIRDAAVKLGGARPDDRFRAHLAHAEPADMAIERYATPTQQWSTPATLEQLWDVLDASPSARFISGGTDLALEVTKRFAEPASLVSLEALPSLRALTASDAGFSLGAAATLTDLEDFARTALVPLERMLRYFGSRQIKNRATIGGNLCTASPIGDLAPVFLALDATCVLLSRDGERRVPIRDFFVAYRKTALRPKEILAKVEVPHPAPGARLASYKVSKRRELDISTVSASFAIITGDDGRVVRARLAYGGMAATPARASATEAALEGQPWTEETVRAATARLAEDFTPISDHRGSAWYRAALAKNLLVGFFHETKDTFVPRLSDRHTATVEVG